MLGMLGNLTNSLDIMATCATKQYTGRMNSLVDSWWKSFMKPSEKGDIT